MSGSSIIAPERIAAWRHAVALAIHVDPESAADGRNGSLCLNGHLHNSGDRHIDLDALAADGLAIGARTMSAGSGRATLATFSALPQGRLAAGERAPVKLELSAAQLADPEATIGIGLAHRDHTWLGDVGFAETLLRSSPPEDADAQALASLSSSAPPPKTGTSLGTAKRGARSTATRHDVVEGYRAFLGREPETEAAIASQLAKTPELWRLLKQIMKSPEGLRWSLYTASEHISIEQDERQNIEILVDNKKMIRLFDHLKAAWASLAQQQPYFSALADPALLSQRLSPKAIETFYATGSHEVSTLQSACDRGGVNLDCKRSVLEFGCRSGRVAEALANRFGLYTGVDLSDAHLSIARRRLLAKGFADARAISVEAFLTEHAAFDVFFSVLALQHCPPPLMLAWLAHALHRLAPGGIAYFQLPCHLYDYSFEFARYLDGRASNGPMELHALPQVEVFHLLERCGMTPLEVRLNGRIGPRGLSYSFLAQKTPKTGSPARSRPS